MGVSSPCSVGFAPGSVAPLPVLLARIFSGSHSPSFSAGNMRVDTRSLAGVYDSGRPSWASVHCEPGAMILEDVSCGPFECQGRARA